MPRTRPPYSPEFRRQMVDLVRAGRSPDDLAREFDPSGHSIRAWVAQADRNEGRREEAASGQTAFDRDFNAAGPNQLWVADITYVPTMAGFLYLAVVLDAWSRKIVGWAMANHLRAELVLDAMAMAVGQRRPKDVIHHSDQGSQYTSVAFGKRCGEAGVRPSMGSVGDAYDNAMAESFFSTLEAELLGRRRFTSQAEARMACFSYIEGWYNPVRLRSRSWQPVTSGTLGSRRPSPRWRGKTSSGPGRGRLCAGAAAIAQRRIPTRF